MTVRILRIVGRKPETRRARLQAVSAWMAAAGWKLVDYSEWEASALFERPEASGSLPRLHPTRWLPGPGALRPGQWFATLRADPRLVLLPAIAALAVAIVGLALFAPPSFDAERIRQEAAAENWYTVDASQLNVREKPDVRAQVVGVLYRDQRVLVEGEVDANWARISVPERGYVAREYLKSAAPPEPE